MTDTPPEIAQMAREKIMALSGEMGSIIGAQMFDSAMEMARASLPPGLPVAEQRRRLFKHIYGKDFDVWD
jgi:hypothetical protein